MKRTIAFKWVVMDRAILLSTVCQPRKSNRPLFLSCLIGFTVLCTAIAPVRAQSQQPNLPNAPTANRFTLTDRVWGANPGNASICYWEDDKLAALSFTVDDNSANNISWWLGQSASNDFHVTWFVITSQVGDGQANHGTWAGFSNAQSLGNDIQSHGVTHLATNGVPNWSIDWDYAESQRQIETNMPGHKCDFLAYPYGLVSSSPGNLNNRTNAASYFGAARGVTGTINPANKIDYLNVNGMTTLNITTPNNYNYLPSLFNASYPGCYRGWAVLICHFISDYSTVQPIINWYAANRVDLWGGLFGDVAKYGQERDTATLTVISNTAEQIVLTLTDQMLDSHFNYPLTIKVRVPSAWSDLVQATQNGQSIVSSVIEHNGAYFSLVRAVPDRGSISLVPADSDGDGIRDIWMLQYFGHANGQSNDNSLAQQDADGDGMTNEKEYEAGTVPTDSASFLKIDTLTNTGNDFLIRFPTVTGKKYRVVRCDDLTTTGCWTEIVADNVPGTGGGVEVADVGAATQPRRFYRVVLRP